MLPSFTLTLEAKVFGQRRPALPASEVTLDLVPDTSGAQALLTLRDLLTAVVMREVEAFGERQEQRKLTRVLLPEAIVRGAELGKIDPGGHAEERAALDAHDGQMASAAAAVAMALQAFEDRLYLVFVDGQQVQALDAPVALHSGSHLLFVRLVALIGG
jgi:hypothetical protein